LHEQVYDKDNWRIIFHSDRGSQFTSKTLAALADAKPWVLFSMSNYAQPTDNAVVERFFLTTKKLQNLWIKVIGNKRNDVYSSVKAAQQIWENWIALFNEEHAYKRNEFIGANQFEMASVHAVIQQKEPPPFETAKTKPRNLIEEVALEEIKQYKSSVKENWETFQNANPLAYKLFLSLNAMEQKLQAVINNQLTMADAIPKQMNEQADDIVNRLTKVIQNKTKQRKRVPRPKRTPLTFGMQLMLQDKALNQVSSVFILRDTLAALLQAATGCRINELRQLKFAELRHLIDSCQIELYQSKQNSIVVKAISEQHQTILKQALTQYEKMLKRLGRTFFDGDYVFCNLNCKENVVLSKKHFNESVNHLLKNFQEQWNERYNANEVLKSHSSRINFCTELFANDVSPAQIKQHMGHKDIRSTYVYNQHVYDVDRQRETLNNIRRKNSNEN
jgi:integrase